MPVCKAWTSVRISSKPSTLSRRAFSTFTKSCHAKAKWPGWRGPDRSWRNHRPNHLRPRTIRCSQHRRQRSQRASAASRRTRAPFAFDELPRLASRLTSLGRQHCFLTDPLGFGGVFFQPQPKLLADHFRDEGLRLGVEQLLLGLVVERGIRQSHGDNRRDAFPQVFARRGEVFQEPLLLGVRVDGTGELVAEARQMGAAIRVHDVVAEGQHQFAGGVGVLQQPLQPIRLLHPRPASRPLETRWSFGG